MPLLPVGEQDYRLRIVAVHNPHKHKIMSIYIHTVDFRMTTADEGCRLRKTGKRNPEVRNVRSIRKRKVRAVPEQTVR
jgi:hypothetical protein